MRADPPFVRPTLRCVAELDLSLPTLDTRLSDLGHPLIQQAQRLPEAHEAGGVERILALSDRVWFKVKTSRWRGAATRLPEVDQLAVGDPPVRLAPWWLGAGGYRRDGDPSDFYASMEAAAKRDGKNQVGPCSDRWLPTDRDWRRLALEHAVAWEYQVRNIVCGLIVRSLRTGHAYRSDVQNYSVTAMARANDGETYMAIGAEKIADAKVFAAILNAVPGIEMSSWQPEPGGVLGLKPESGEIIWSTILPTAVADQLLDKYPDVGV
jgi:hypothetical protein